MRKASFSRAHLESLPGNYYLESLTLCTGIESLKDNSIGTFLLSLWYLTESLADREKPEKCLLNESTYDDHTNETEWGRSQKHSLTREHSLTEEMGCGAVFLSTNPSLLVLGGDSQSETKVGTDYNTGDRFRSGVATAVGRHS